MQQDIRFCTSKDGTRIAYAVHGSGPLLVHAAHWLTHLEYDWESPVWRHWRRDLGERFTVVRYDERGSGLSDRNVSEQSPDRWLEDLEAVVDHAGLERVTLLGVSGGGPLALSYGAKHPGRVKGLILYGTYLRGHAARGPEAGRKKLDLYISLIRCIAGDGVGRIPLSGASSPASLSPTRRTIRSAGSMTSRSARPMGITRSSWRK